ncbi:MAG: DUF2156 domain-containing protein [Armatimonadota bacterium]
MIPTFPEFAPIALEHKGEVDAVLARARPLASEYTFTNLFAWAESSHYQLARFEDGLLIRKEADGHASFLQPLMPGDADAAVQACLDAAGTIGRVGEDFLARLDLAKLPAVREDRDDFDYVYSVPELIALHGPKYHDKKNLLHQLDKAADWQYRPMTPELIERSLPFQHHWCQERNCTENEGLLREHCATFRMLTNFTALGLKGGAIEIDGRLAAITLGEPLNADTCVIHIEKAMGGLPGLYQAINREFLRDACADYAFVNREQDLGLPGLRKAKLSYNPARMVKKYTISG